MKGDLQSISRSGPLLPTVITIIIVSFGALVWEWRHAHTPAVHPDSPRPHQQSVPTREGEHAGASQPPSSRSITTSSL